MLVSANAKLTWRLVYGYLICYLAGEANEHFGNYRGGSDDMGEFESLSDDDKVDEMVTWTYHLIFPHVLSIIHRSKGLSKSLEEEDDWL